MSTESSIFKARGRAALSDMLVTAQALRWHPVDPPIDSGQPNIPQHRLHARGVQANPVLHHIQGMDEGSAPPGEAFLLSRDAISLSRPRHPAAGFQADLAVVLVASWRRTASASCWCRFFPTSTRRTRMRRSRLCTSAGKYFGA